MKKRGSFTVFLALVAVIIVSMVITLINSVRVTTAIATIEMINSMGISSAFAQYDRDLFEEFGLLMIEGSMSDLEETIEAYITENTDIDTTFFDVVLDDIKVNSCYRPVSQGGGFFEKQIVDYMKYAFPVNIGADIVKQFLGYTEDNPTQNVSNQVVELTEDLYEMPPLIYQLISYVDGVKLENGRIATDSKRVFGTPEFAKMITTAHEPNSMGINHSRIYTASLEYIYNPIDALVQIQELYQLYLDTRLIGTYLVLDKKVDEFEKKLDVCIEYHNKAIETTVLLLGITGGIDEKATNILKYLEEYRDCIDEELYEALKEDIATYKGMQNYAVNEICDYEKIHSALVRNKNILQEMKDISEMNFITFSKDDIIKNDRQLKEYIETFENYSVADIKIDYNNVDIYSKKSDTSILEQLKSLYDKGIMHFVLSGKAVSEKKITDNYRLLTKGPYPYSGSDYLARNTLYNEYGLNMFTSFTDAAKGNHLDYEIEYILQGKISDRENLSATISDIIGIRELADLTYLFTDKEKTYEANELATILVASFGIPGLVTITKLLIMVIWAYAEALTDVRSILAGERTPFMKSRDTWNISFENLLALDLSATSENKGKVGVVYEDYLRFLLYLENYGTKNQGMMNLIELHMINNGNRDFRMSNMIMAANVDTTYIYNGNQKYEAKLVFSY